MSASYLHIVSIGLVVVLRTQGGEWDARKKAFVFQRYCHVYAQGDLRKLFEPLSNWVVSANIQQAQPKNPAYMRACLSRK